MDLGRLALAHLKVNSSMTLKIKISRILCNLFNTENLCCIIIMLVYRKSKRQAG